MDSASSSDGVTHPPAESSVYFDGQSSRRRPVTIALKDRLEIIGDGTICAQWPYADVRKVDSPSGILRLSCLSAPALARLEIRDTALAADLASRCGELEKDRVDGRGVARIVGWSLAATASIAAMVFFAVPFAANRLAPLIPESFERRLGEAADTQIKTLFGGQTCNDVAGQQAFRKLVNGLRQPAGLDTSVQAVVLATDVPNAFALPGGKVYLFNGLLAKAQNPDEIAGVLAHELGHLKHRDNTRELIYNGGTSFLIGLLFGDVTGSGAAIFAARSVVTSSYSRDAETNADNFSIEVMHTLGRPTKPMGDLMFRVTGKQGDSGLSILASHPLTEDRLKHMSEEDRPASGPPLLTAAEWASLKKICGIK
jgi:Zn-dependent protease with chaperone function